jgi:ABC-2 type transport system ATP-binding protein
MNTELAIKVTDLVKCYGGFRAVNKINLSIQKGEVFALLGPNGAGKTTTIEILEGHRKKTSGFISVLGNNPEKNSHSFRNKIGIVLQDTGIEPYLTVKEVLTQFSGFYDNPMPINKLLNLTGTQPFRNMRVKKLSGGQKRRLDVAIGLSGNPDLIFLDEPTTGFDPAARRESWDMIKKLQSFGKTILLTTHYMDEAEYLANRIALMFKGTIKTIGTLDELRQESKNTTISFTINTNEVLPESILKIAQFSSNNVTIQTYYPTQTLYDVTNWAHANNIVLNQLKVTPASLEDIFLQMVKEQT